MSLDKLLALVRYCHQEKNLEDGTSSSGVIAWCGFIKIIVSFTWIGKIVQYLSTVDSWGVDVSLLNHVKNRVCNLFSYLFTLSTLIILLVIMLYVLNVFICII